MTTELARIRRDTLRQALAEGAKEAPLVATVLAVLSGLFRGLNESRFQNFLECVGKPLGCDDFEAASKYVEENIEQPWMVEGLDRGWRAVLETLDPLARRCAYLMVADYMAQKKEPDRFHRQFGNFLMESDAQVLAIFLRISNLLDEKEVDWCGIILAMRKSHPDPFTGRPTRPPVLLPRCEIQLFRDGENYDAIAFGFEDFREACDVLRRNSLISPWSGEEWKHPHPNVFEVDEHVGIIDERQMERWRRLREYISPLEQEIVAADRKRQKDSEVG